VKNAQEALLKLSRNDGAMSFYENQKEETLLSTEVKFSSTITLKLMKIATFQQKCL